MKPRNRFEEECSRDMQYLSDLTNEEERHIQGMLDEMDCEAISSLYDVKSWNNSYGVRSGYSTYRRVDGYFTVIEACKGKQVIRTFWLNLSRRGYSSMPNERYTEVVQHWFAKDGRHCVIAKSFRMAQGFDNWAFGSEMSVKKEIPREKISSYSDRWEYLHCANKKDTVIRSLSQEFIRMGFRRSLLKGSAHPVKSLKMLFSKHGEYLVKTRQKDLFAAIASGKVSQQRFEKYYPQVKIAYRHGYRIKDYGMWFDMIDALEYLDKDIHSPHYLLPKDFKYAHDHWTKKKVEKEFMEKLRKDLEKAAGHEDEYQRRIRPFMDLDFRMPFGLHIRCIKTIKEMYEEGLHMHHCVGGYWNRKDSLIMVCRDTNDNRIATIEICLQDFHVVQIRGVSNTVPKYYDTIRAKLLESMPLIREAAEKKKTKTRKIA